MEFNDSHGEFINRVMNKIKETNSQAHQQFQPLELVRTVCNGPAKGHQMTYDTN